MEFQRFIQLASEGAPYDPRKFSDRDLVRHYEWCVSEVYYSLNREEINEASARIIGKAIYFGQLFGEYKEKRSDKDNFFG